MDYCQKILTQMEQKFDKSLSDLDQRLCTLVSNSKRIENRFSSLEDSFKLMQWNKKNEIKRSKNLRVQLLKEMRLEINLDIQVLFDFKQKDLFSRLETITEINQDDIKQREATVCIDPSEPTQQDVQTLQDQRFGLNLTLKVKEFVERYKEEWEILELARVFDEDNWQQDKDHRKKVKKKEL